MVTQLVTAVLGALLVVVAFGGWREGALLGSRRGQRRFVVTVLATALAGLALAGVALVSSVREPAQRILTGARYRMAIPDGWVRMTDLEEQLGLEARVYGDDRHELMVVETEPRPTGTEGTVRDALASVAGDGPDGGRTTVQEREGWVRVDRRYDSPRGAVIARTLAYVDPSRRAGIVTATCTHDGDVQACERALSSFELTVPTLPLDAALAER